jgi:hypothetical protein
MATADTALSQPRRLNVSRVMLRHPELSAAAAVTAAWVTLLVLAIRGVHGRTSYAAMAGSPWGGRPHSTLRGSGRPPGCPPGC